MSLLQTIEAASWKSVVLAAVLAVCLTVLFVGWMHKPSRYVHTVGPYVLDKNAGRVFNALKE